MVRTMVIFIRRSVKQVAAIIACAAILSLTACSNGDDNGADLSAVSREFAVGTTQMTLIDTSRPTAAHGSVPEQSSRTIPITLVYPAEGTPGSEVAPNAPVAASAARFPLVVLSHGLGAYREYLLPLAEVWASRGYVAALPLFPLTNNTTVGGPVAQDVQNQPADVSFVIDEVLAQSSTPGTLLNNAIDGEKIAVSGHSNGAITTYGLAAHSCCRDPRVDAAVVLSGAVSPFGGGVYDLSDTPPIFLVHGVDDIMTNYNHAARSYNQLQPPKGFLSLEESDHYAYLSSDDPAFDVVAQATADFLDGELRDDGAALERLSEDQVPGIAAMHWAPDDASNVPLETLPEPETNRQAFLSADSNLVDGQVITVTWSGFLPDKIVNIMQCTGDVTGGSAACNISGGTLFHPDPEGMGSLDLVIHTGPIGNGVCDSDNPCVVLVNDASLPDEAAMVRIPITFAD
jgi:predicted esterase